MIDNIDLLTTNELARMFGVTRQRIHAMCARGQIPHVRKGAQYLFSRRVIERNFEAKIRAAAERESMQRLQISLTDLIEDEAK